MNIWTFVTACHPVTPQFVLSYIDDATVSFYHITCTHTHITVDCYLHYTCIHKHMYVHNTLSLTHSTACTDLHTCIIKQLTQALGSVSGSPRGRKCTQGWSSLPGHCQSQRQYTCLHTAGEKRRGRGRGGGGEGGGGEGGSEGGRGGGEGRGAAFITMGIGQMEQDFPYMATFIFPCKSQYVLSVHKPQCNPQPSSNLYNLSHTLASVLR